MAAVGPFRGQGMVINSVDCLWINPGIPTTAPGLVEPMRRV